MLQRSLLLSLLCLVLAFSAQGQASSATDGHTPSGLAPGAPAGSYALSGFDNVNPYNGGLNFKLPLMQVGGRGSASYTMALPIEPKWRAMYSSDTNPMTGITTEFLDAEYGWWTGSSPGYGPGLLIGRKSGWGELQCPGSQTLQYGIALTRLTFVTPNGTEYELIDKLREGAPMGVPCSAGVGESRGTVFVTTDGTSATFISSQTIYDAAYPGDDVLYVSGVLIMRDGTRYEIDNSIVKSVTDRQGNKLEFHYGYGPRLEWITDSLGRRIDIEYNITEAPYGLCDRITYKGFENASRTIRVSRKNLGSVLRSGFQLRTYKALFPELWSASTTTNHDPTVISEVWLPDGSRSYKFRYNDYGELARVELPTGGAYEYDWAAGAENSYQSGFIGGGRDSHIYRRVVQRRVYPDGVNVESSMVISRPESPDGNGLYNNLGYVWVHQVGPIGTPLSITKHYYYGSPIASMLYSDPIGYSSWKEGKEYKTEVFDTTGATVLRRIEYVWQQCVPNQQCEMNMNWTANQAADARPSNNPQTVATTTTLLDGGANQVSKRSFKYDKYNNLTDTWDYDYGAGEAPAHPSRRTHTDYLVTNNGVDYTSTNVHIRNLPAGTWVKAIDTSNGVETANPIAKSELAYDEPAYPFIEYGSVTGWSSPNSNPSFAAARGNVTTIKSWKDITNDLFIVTHAQYDQLGNLRKSWDGRGKLSEIEYASAQHYAFPTKTISPAVPDPADPVHSTIIFETTSTYDLPSGLLTSTTDANNQKTTIEYNDPLDRPTLVNFPSGGGWKSFAYGDSIGNLYVRVQTAFDATRTLESRQYFDGLGRSVRSYQSEGSSWLVSDTQYDAGGRVWRVSNTYRDSALGGAINPSGLWTTTEYDLLGRIKLVTMPDGAAVSTTYSGSTTTVTTPATTPATAPQSRKRRTVTDGLGRLMQVVEDPDGWNYETDYTYDVLGNLRKVVQGEQQRYFMYDALSRLVRLKMPEQQVNTNLNLTDALTGNSSWSLGYTYDDTGNIMTRTDARNITATFDYDALSRNTTVRYSDSTPGINQYYDGATSGKGKAWKSETLGDAGSLTTINSYDALGRTLMQRQHFKSGSVWSEPYIVQHSYGLAGQLLSKTYPSGHVATYLYDDAGRPRSFSGNLGDGVERTYASETNYDTAGRMQEEKYGTLQPLYNKRRYNVRSQLYDVRLSTMSRTQDAGDWNRGCLAFYYTQQNSGLGTSGTDNNGNLVQSETYVPNADGSYLHLQDRYSYDALNRLEKVSEYQYPGAGQHVFTQAYSYDRYGNRKIDLSLTTDVQGINRKEFEVETATNRLYAKDDLGLPDGQRKIQYDAAGNQRSDIHTGSGSRTYDAENRMITATDNGTGWTSRYAYDAGGRRVRRAVNNQPEVWQVYGIDGELLAEYAAGNASFVQTKEYGYRSGQLLVTASNGDESRLTRFVNNIFYGAWGRSPSTQERQQKVNQLASSGAQGQAQLLADAKQTLSDMFNDAQYTQRNRTNRQYAGDLYWSYFGRGAQASELDYWEGRLNLPTNDPQYITREGLRQVCEAWSEFTTLVSALWGTAYDNQRVDHWLWNVYIGSVGAAPSTGQMQPHIVALNEAGAQGQTALIAKAHEIARQKMESAEYAARNRTDEEFVADLHQVFWQRTPDASSLSHWTNQVALRGREYVLDRFALSSAFQEVAGTLYKEVLWLIADHLGTPRMIAERTGSLSGIKRHDYLPFGEEIGAGLSGRTAEQGYAADSVRQQFTSYERDDETGLDYAQARYYASPQGRFTSVDPIMITNKRLKDPQSINLYTYTRNNPLKYNDPTGEYFVGTNGKRVGFKIDDKGKIVLGKNASADLVRMARLVNKSGSEIARAQFAESATNETKNHFKIVKEEKNNGLLGLHQAHDKNGKPLKWEAGADGTGKFDGQPAYIKDKDGNMVYKEATITVFEGNIKNDLNNIRSFYGDPKITSDEAVVGTFTHETDHNTNQEAIDAIRDRQEGRPNNLNVEEPAEEIEERIYDEFRRRRKP